MDITTLLIYGVAALIALWVLKIIIRIPFYLMTIGILFGLGYVAYKYVLPMFGIYF